MRLRRSVPDATLSRLIRPTSRPYVVCRPDKAFTPHPAFGTRFTELKNPQLHAAFNRHDLPVRTQHGHD
ncbi:hypothetical protein BE964_21140 [Escherichia coli]|nr:hypothetical protein BE964_21140 [Escherichia coli]AQV49321.1 hypothetical protein BE966_28095 [Escherichia coli]AQV58209.1 hypothetical protein BE941_18120 [Escherichia coli]AQV65028.1 hypothetical protein BE928_25715 [Escherichia coli]AQV75341.1 hypothetical protein BE932_24440 [Escherichia coli]